MAVLLDYNDYYFLNKNSKVFSKSASFYPHESASLKFVVKGNTSKIVLFSVNPIIPALSFNPEAVLKKSSVFELKVNASLLPKAWSGDLIINDSGVISKVPLNFSVKNLNK